MITSRPTLPSDSWLFTELREAEELELQALGTNSQDCMRRGMLYSRAQTVFIDGEPAAMWGIMDYGEQNVVWAVFTKAIDRHPLQFLRESRRLAMSFKSEVINIVDARNVKAVKWFRWLGFEVSEPEPYGVNGEMFHRFTNARRRAEAA